MVLKKKPFLCFSALAIALPLLHQLDATIRLIHPPSPYFSFLPFLPTTVRPLHPSILPSQMLGERRGEMIMRRQSEQMFRLVSKRGGR